VEGKAISKLSFSLPAPTFQETADFLDFIGLAENESQALNWQAKINGYFFNEANFQNTFFDMG
jgi:hypothetical protein